ncbi:uncharacterized protein LOC135832245 [Planococcus citri]|uniref:uncharacterized protein LOC135832245 n=1 Tax=Planococcus citri TaxID=170843 RepID=UPI0031FA13F1
MENAIIAFETAFKDTQSKLDTITWKLESFEKDVLSCVRRNVKGKMISVMDLMHNIRDIRNDFLSLRAEMMDVEEKNKEVHTIITNLINSAYNEHAVLREMLKNYEGH